MARRFGIVAGLATAFVLLLAINLLAGLLLRDVKVDLTDDKLFTLSKGSKEILGGLQDSLKLKLFYSKRAASGLPQIHQYADRVTELLKQYEAASKGKLSLEILDPRPDTETEEWAVKYGLRPIQISPTENLYFGLALVSEVGTEESIPFLDPSREAFLEYDLSRLVSSLSNPEKKTIGILSSLNVMGGPGNDPMARMQGRPPAEPWIFVQDLRRQYKVEAVSPTAESIDDKYNLLIVIHPKQLSAATEYAIDQYLMRGGRLVVMVDPLSVYDQANFSSPDPNQRFSASFDSNLPKLFAAWGIDMPTAKVVADLDLATELRVSQNRIEKHPTFLTLSSKQCNQEEIVSSNLESLVLGNAGALKKKADCPYQVTTLLNTTASAAEIDGFMLKFGSDPDQLRRDFKPGSEKLPLAIRLTGKFKTAFPAGRPAGAKPEDQAAPPPPDKPHVAEAEKENAVIVISDVDMIADDFSVRKQNLFGQTIAQPINDNLSFMSNAAENMLGSQELISLRTRGKSRRPFTLVDRLEGEAQKRFKAEEDELKKKEEETNQKLTELQSGKDKAGRAILSPEQAAEIESFRHQLADTKTKLRGVRRNLRQDIEQLGSTLKFINIALMPILVLLAGLFLPAAWRSYKMRSNNG